MHKVRKDLGNRPERSRIELQIDSRTLRYELGMLIRLAQEFYSRDVLANPIASNAFIESFAVHCRALIHFLFGHLEEATVQGEKLRFGGLRPTDVIAYDFHRTWEQDCPEPTNILVQAKHQTDKHVAHITIDRRDLNQPGSGRDSNWDLREATSAICDTVGHFLAKAQPRSFDEIALRQMKTLIAEWASPTVLQASPSAVAGAERSPAFISAATTSMASIRAATSVTHTCCLEPFEDRFSLFGRTE
jgi:hypothetical protein